MAYIPNSLAVYIAAYTGSLSGMAMSGRYIELPHATVVLDYTIAAGAFAQELDTLYIGGDDGTACVELINQACESVWQNRTNASHSSDPVFYAGVCQGIIDYCNELVVYFASQGIPTNIPTPPASVTYVFNTAANFTQPAANATVSVTFNATNWLVANAPVFIAGAGLYTVDSITNQTVAVLRNTGVDGNAAPTTVVGSGAYAYLAHGMPWSFTHSVAGTFNDRVPIGSRPRLSMRIRPGAGGGGGGGAGGSGFTATTTGGGGSGGAGGQTGGGAASVPIDNIQCVAGETLTTTVGAGGTGGAGATSPGTNGNPGNPGGLTSVTGSISGPMVRTANPATNPVCQGGPGGTGGATGTSTTGGAARALGGNVLKWGYNFGGQGTSAQGSAAGGSATAGANGGSIPTASAPSGSIEFGTGTDTIPFWGNNGAGVAGGTGNGSNRGGGGAGGPGAGGSFGDMWPIAGNPVEQNTSCVGGIPGHGGNADGNANITAGGDGTDGVNGQGGAGGAGGGGGGSATGTGGAGANGGKGGKGSDGIAVISGSML